MTRSYMLRVWLLVALATSLTFTSPSAASQDGAGAYDLLMTDAPCSVPMGWSEITRPLSADRPWPPQRGTEYDYVTHVAPSAVAPNRLYAGGEAGVYRSDDCGQNWHILPLVHSPSVAVAVHADRYDRLYASSTEGRLQVSDDGGSTWRLPVAILPSGARVSNLWAVVRAVSMGPDATTIVRSYKNYSMLGGSFPIAFWISTDMGQTFRPIGDRWNIANDREWLADNPDATAIDPRDPYTIYAVTRGSGALRSRDGGLTWTPFADTQSSPAENVRQIEISADGSRLWLLTSQGRLFSSLDDGATWESINELPSAALLVRVTANRFDPTSVFGITRAGEGGDCCHLWVYHPATQQ